MTIQVCGRRLILVTHLDQRTQLQRRFNQLLLELHCCHVGKLDGLPILQADASGGQGLSKVIHGVGRLVGISARHGGHIGHALDRRHRIIQIDAGIGKLADVFGHIGKGVDGPV